MRCYYGTGNKNSLTTLLAHGEDLFPAQQNAAIEALNLQSKSMAIPRFVGKPFVIFGNSNLV